MGSEGLAPLVTASLFQAFFWKQVKKMHCTFMYTVYDKQVLTSISWGWEALEVLEMIGVLCQDEPFVQLDE